MVISMNSDERVDILKRTTCLLLQSGFQANQIGYRYLREAVLIACQDEETVTSVTKLLYPEIAKRFRANDKQVERAIRNSIETAWVKGNQKVLHEIFAEHLEKTSTRPTNTEVIKVLRDRISKEQ
ncbi:MAG: sporulation initiation factor Spo0A C-terminal domain-containing protein [Lachnospiraceae bacterium]|nr:sporulation initiation factor Spo0A C-terminal domain-containing protein [Lachnospiraceae bacterium]